MGSKVNKQEEAGPGDQIVYLQLNKNNERNQKLIRGEAPQLALKQLIHLYSG